MYLWSSLAIAVVMTVIRQGQTKCRGGCCIHSTDISVQVQTHPRRLTSAPGLSFPQDGENATLYLVDSWVQACFRCTGAPSHTCPWARPTVWWTKTASGGPTYQAKAVKLCGKGFTDHVKAGYYHCRLHGVSLSATTRALVVDQIKCLLPPPVHDAVMESYHVKDIQNGFGDTVVYSCRDDRRKTKVSTCKEGIPLGHWSKVEHVCEEPKQCQDNTPQACGALSDQLCRWGHPMNKCQKSCGVCEPVARPMVRKMSGSLTCVDQDQESPPVRKRSETDDYAYHDYGEMYDAHDLTVSLSHEWMTRHGIHDHLTPADILHGDVKCRARIGWKVSPWSEPFNARNLTLDHGHIVDDGEDDTSRGPGDGDDDDENNGRDGAKLGKVNNKTEKAGGKLRTGKVHSKDPAKVNDSTPDFSTGVSTAKHLDKNVSTGVPLEKEVSRAVPWDKNESTAIPLENEVSTAIPREKKVSTAISREIEVFTARQVYTEDHEDGRPNETGQKDIALDKGKHGNQGQGKDPHGEVRFGRQENENTDGSSDGSVRQRSPSPQGSPTPSPEETDDLPAEWIAVGASVCFVVVVTVLACCVYKHFFSAPPPAPTGAGPVMPTAGTGMQRT